MPHGRYQRVSGLACRDGRVVCGRVEIMIGRDDRLGLAPGERSFVTARFLEPSDPRLLDELTRLLRRRGAAAHRVAEQLDPIELIVDGAEGSRRLVGRLQPPQWRYGDLRDIEFGIREEP